MAGSKMVGWNRPARICASISATRLRVNSSRPLNSFDCIMPERRLDAPDRSAPIGSCSPASRGSPAE